MYMLPLAQGFVCGRLARDHIEAKILDVVSKISASSLPGALVDLTDVVIQSDASLDPLVKDRLQSVSEAGEGRRVPSSRPVFHSRSATPSAVLPPL